MLTGFARETGTFQAHMEVELVNDGPVTILLDSEKALIIGLSTPTQTDWQFYRETI